MKSILVFGVAVVDFIFKLDEMPAKPEKFRATEAKITGGGCAANAAVAISRLGGKAKLVSRLGSDMIAEFILQDLEAEGVNCQGCRKFENHQSSFSSIYIDRNGNRQLVNYRDTNLPDQANWLDEDLFNGHDAILADCRWPGGAARAMEIARLKNIPGILDVENNVHEAEHVLPDASHIAFSLTGFEEWGKRNSDSSTLEDASLTYKAWCCFTDGENGVSYSAGVGTHKLSTFEISAVDTLGAGDVWHGAFALRLAETQSEIEAIEFANAAAAIKCTRFGGREGIPIREEVEQFLKDQQ